METARQQEVPFETSTEYSHDRRLLEANLGAAARVHLGVGTWESTTECKAGMGENAAFVEYLAREYRVAEAHSHWKAGVTERSTGREPSGNFYIVISRPTLPDDAEE